MKDFNELADKVITGVVWLVVVGACIIVIAAIINTFMGAPSI
jgi:hypothetical protein